MNVFQAFSGGAGMLGPRKQKARVAGFYRNKSKAPKAQERNYGKHKHRDRNRITRVGYSHS